MVIIKVNQEAANLLLLCTVIIKDNQVAIKVYQVAIKDNQVAIKDNQEAFKDNQEADILQHQCKVNTNHNSTPSSKPIQNNLVMNNPDIDWKNEF